MPGALLAQQHRVNITTMQAGKYPASVKAGCCKVHAAAVLLSAAQV